MDFNVMGLGLFVLYKTGTLEGVELAWCEYKEILPYCNCMKPNSITAALPIRP